MIRGSAADDGADIAKGGDHVPMKIGAIVKPRQIPVVAEPPRTRPGKTMRRLVRDVAENRSIGDVTTWLAQR